MNATDTPTTLRPADLAELWWWLKDHGYKVSPQQTLAASRVLSSSVAPPLTELWRWLAPIFCTTATEQQNFRSHYIGWLKVRGLPVPDDAVEMARTQLSLLPRPMPNTPLAGVLTLLSTLLLVAYLYHQLHPVETQVVVKQGQSVLGDALVQSDRGSVGGGTVRYRRWDLPIALDVTHPKVGSDGKPARVSRSLTTVVPSIDIEMPEPPIEKPIDAVTSMGNRVMTLPAPEATLNEGPPGIESVRLYPKALFSYLTLLLIPLSWWLFAQLRRRGFLERLPAQDEATRQHFSISPNSGAFIYAADLRYLGREMRRKRYVATRDLDMPSTLAATVQTGIPKMVFGTRAEPDYLMLIDRIHAKDHQGRLANEVVGFLATQGISLDCYEFDEDPRRSVNVPLDGLTINSGYQSLAQLFARHPEARLLIFSDGGSLIDRYTGRPHLWMPSLLMWPAAALITPQARSAWSLREWMLDQSGLAVLPLDGDGLHQLGDVLRGDRSWPRVEPGARERTRPAYLRDVDLLTDSIRPDARHVEVLLTDLRRDLGRDGMIWLAGCAIYPEVHWGLTIAVGEALLLPGADALRGAVRATPPTLKFARILGQLVRLPWLRLCFMPDWFRESLLTQMSPSDEAAARAAISAYLASISPAHARQTRRDTLEISGKEAGAWKDLLRGARAWWRGEPPLDRTEDRIFLRFMSARPRLAVAASDALALIFYKQGSPLGGPHLWPLVVWTLLVAGAVYQYPPIKRFVRPSEPVIVIPKPSTIGIDGAGSLLVFANDRGPLSVRSLDAAGISGMQGCKLDVPHVEKAVVSDGYIQLVVHEGETYGLKTLPVPTFGKQDCEVDVQTRPLAVFAATSWQTESVRTDQYITAPFGVRIRLPAPSLIPTQVLRRRPTRADHPDVLCTVLDATEITLFDREFLSLLPLERDTPSHCTVSGDANTIFVATAQGRIFQFALGGGAGFRTATGRGQRQPIGVARSSGLRHSDGSIVSMSTDRGGKTLALVRSDGSVWLQRSLDTAWQTLGQIAAAGPVAISEGGSLMAVTNLRGQAELWTLSKLEDGKAAPFVAAPGPAASQAQANRTSAPPGSAASGSAPVASTAATSDLSLPQFEKLRYEIFTCEDAHDQAQGKEVLKALSDLHAPARNIRMQKPITVKTARTSFLPTQSNNQVRYSSKQSVQVAAMKLIQTSPVFMNIARWDFLEVSRDAEDVMRFLVCNQIDQVVSKAEEASARVDPDTLHIDPSVLKASIWAERDIPVCWEDLAASSEADRNLVQRSVADSWSKASAVKFIGWTSCPADFSGVRIAVADTSPHAKALGRLVRGVRDGLTLNFTFQKNSQPCQSQRDTCIKAMAVHEFGHILGFAHQNNRPDAPADCRDVSKGGEQGPMLGQYDPISVMNYCNPTWLNNGNLSDGDIDAVRMMYGRP